MNFVNSIMKFRLYTPNYVIIAEIMALKIRPQCIYHKPGEKLEAD
ncbi:hypothetical protein [Clostridium sp. SHJSY1]|nr:hypothetical protein [Clostridium sp. SHJSY1]